MTTEKVQIVERAMQKLSRPACTPTMSRPRSGCSPTMHPGGTHDLHRYALQVIDQPTRTGPNPSMTNCNKTAAIWS